MWHDRGRGHGDVGIRRRYTYHELSEARAVPASPDTAVPGPTAVTVKIYPRVEGKPSSVYFDGHQEIPFAVLKHFTDLVAAGIEAQAT
jgi:hypothetical protein